MTVHREALPLLGSTAGPPKVISYINQVGPGRFRCKICNFVGPSMAGLKSHLGFVHKKKTCRLCDFVGDAVVLREHEKWRHGDHFSKDYGFRKGSYYCKHRTCPNDKFDKEVSMIAHVSMVHGAQTPPAGSGSNSSRDEDEIEVLPIRTTTGSPASKSGPRPEKNIKCDLCSYRLVR